MPCRAFLFSLLEDCVCLMGEMQLRRNALSGIFVFSREKWSLFLTRTATSRNALSGIFVFSPNKVSLSHEGETFFGRNALSGIFVFSLIVECGGHPTAFSRNALSGIFVFSHNTCREFRGHTPGSQCPVGHFCFLSIYLALNDLAPAEWSQCPVGHFCFLSKQCRRARFRRRLRVAMPCRAFLFSLVICRD